MSIFESKRDYLDNDITLLFDGNTPSEKEIKERVFKDYGIELKDCFFDITEPSKFRGYENCGVIRIDI